MLSLSESSACNIDILHVEKIFVVERLLKLVREKWQLLASQDWSRLTQLTGRG